MTDLKHSESLTTVPVVRANLSVYVCLCVRHWVETSKKPNRCLGNQVLSLVPQGFFIFVSRCCHRKCRLFEKENHGYLLHNVDGDVTWLILLFCSSVRFFHVLFSLSKCKPTKKKKKNKGVFPPNVQMRNASQARLVVKQRACVRNSSDRSTLGGKGKCFFAYIFVWFEKESSVNGWVRPQWQLH